MVTLEMTRKGYKFYWKREAKEKNPSQYKCTVQNECLKSTSRKNLHQSKTQALSNLL